MLLHTTNEGFQSSKFVQYVIDQVQESGTMFKKSLLSTALAQAASPQTAVASDSAAETAKDEDTKSSEKESETLHDVASTEPELQKPTVEQPSQSPTRLSPMGSPTHSSKGSRCSSASSAREVAPKMTMTPWGALPAAAPPSQHDETAEAQRQQELREERARQAKKAQRDAMIETYNRLQKQRKDLRKRNLQAQTNIAQYMRKHGMEIIAPHDIDRSQTSLREEYNQLLNKIEDLAAAKEDEEEQLENHMHEIKDKKKLLQNEINRLQNEMNTVKAQICNEPLSSTNTKSMQQRVSSFHK